MERKLVWKMVVRERWRWGMKRGGRDERGRG